MLRVVSLLPSATEILARIIERQPVGRLGTVVRSERLLSATH
jgi:hypothetical protein